MPKHAFALRRVTDAGTRLRHPEGAVIENMDDGQFIGWRVAGIVREATADEVAAAREGHMPKAEAAAEPGPNAIENPPPAPKPKKPRKKKAAAKTGA